MPKVSASWKASLPISLLVTWPVMATMGMESIMASTRPVVEVGGAGAGGGAADADLAGGARVAFGGEGGILLVAHQDVADVVVVEGVVEGKGDAAGVAEDAIDALAGQAFEQAFSRRSSRLT